MLFSYTWHLCLLDSTVTWENPRIMFDGVFPFFLFFCLWERLEMEISFVFQLLGSASSHFCCIVLVKWAAPICLISLHVRLNKSIYISTLPPLKSHLGRFIPSTWVKYNPCYFTWQCSQNAYSIVAAWLTAQHQKAGWGLRCHMPLYYLQFWVLGELSRSSWYFHWSYKWFISSCL